MALCIGIVSRRLMSLTPAYRRRQEAAQQLDSQFDLKYGVDTSGRVVPAESDVVGSNWIHGAKYDAEDATALDEILSELPIRYDHFTFVDLGSGKGRAVLVASRFPFKRVMGVEYSKTLNEIA